MIQLPRFVPWDLACDASTVPPPSDDEAALHSSSFYRLLRANRSLQIDPRRKNPDEQPPKNPIRMPVIDTDNGQMDIVLTAGAWTGYSLLNYTKIYIRIRKS